MATRLELEESEVQETFFENGWTDGLPIVPPTPERVEAMIGDSGHQPDDLIGVVPERSRSVSVEQVAISAVMAGCRPDYFPVVLAATSALLDPKLNPHVALSSSGGPAICVVVSGPLAARIGMNARQNVLGAGNRANATIGRTIRLVAINVLGSSPDGLDGASIGHPGKYSFCFAEDVPPEPWKPLAVDLGYAEGDTAVLVSAVEAPAQVGNHMSGEPDRILDTFVAAMQNPARYAVGKAAQGIPVLGPEHAGAIIAAGWSRRDVREYLAEKSRVTPEFIEQAGVVVERDGQHALPIGDDGKLPVAASPDDIFPVTAGGPGAGWSAYVPCYFPRIHSLAVSRRVPGPGDGLPACDDEDCEIPFGEHEHGGV